ncbi:MAG: superoxide dismutase family protein [Lentisphaeria bacterium]|nr:superoxide dismutase family protein [Lentisphaeria bacterium]
MLYLAPSLSMLCGMYYEAAVTRYAPRLRWLVSHAGGFFVFAAAMALLLFCVLPEETLHMITDLEYPVDFRKDLFYQGTAFSAFYTDRFYPEDIVGKVVVIHAMPDDFKSQPSGNPGSMIACGEIKEM